MISHLSVHDDGSVDLRDYLWLLPQELLPHALHVIEDVLGGLPLSVDPRYDAVDGLDGHDAPCHAVEGGGVRVLGVFNSSILDLNLRFGTLICKLKFKLGLK